MKVCVYTYIRMYIHSSKYMEFVHVCIYKHVHTVNTYVCICVVKVCSTYACIYMHKYKHISQMHLCVYHKVWYVVYSRDL